MKHEFAAMVQEVDRARNPEKHNAHSEWVRETFGLRPLKNGQYRAVSMRKKNEKEEPIQPAEILIYNKMIGMGVLYNDVPILRIDYEFGTKTCYGFNSAMCEKRIVVGYTFIPLKRIAEGRLVAICAVIRNYVKLSPRYDSNFSRIKLGEYINGVLTSGEKVYVSGKVE